MSELLLERLADGGVSDRVADLVLAALEGDETLAEVAGGTSVDRSGAGAAAERGAERAYLRGITVEGFRGVGPQARLDLEPGPGLTLVVGRNGSGKSSFAEAAELLLTGDNKRWSGRPPVWKDGWRNLHHPDAAIEVDLLLDGESGATGVRCEWDAGADLDRRQLSIQPQGKPRQKVTSFAWDGPIRTYRPFLSYNELASMLDERPADLYDALAAVLGLGELDDALSRLANRRLALEKVGKELARTTATLVRRCNESDDERANRAHDLLSVKTPNLDALENLAVATDQGSETDELALLKQVQQVVGPDWQTAAKIAIDIRAAMKDAADAAGTDAGRARELAGLLDAALALHEHQGDQPCPVCKAGSLDSTWRAAAADERDRLRTEAADAKNAARALQRAIAEGRQQLTGPPFWLTRPVPDSVQAKALHDAWEAWASFSTDDPLGLADHLDRAQPVAELAVDVRQAASKEVAAREDLWRPIARDIAAWVVQARKATAADAAAKEIKQAETWLKQTSADLRDERFAPIADGSRALWAQLRQQSNVELEAIEMKKSGKIRSVTLAVTVDGVESSALGVMSQGELHALALSLFLPRATSAESPFRFVVIDDPVQAMDPARVDGLARVLAKTAETHQVLVFSHDDRLPESLRRQRIAAKVIEVVRRADSRVEVREAMDPVRQALSDARALAKTEDLPEATARRLVPGFCRLAIEAAATAVVRRRDLAAGVPHAEVEDRLRAADGLMKLLALALHGEIDKFTSVLQDVESRWGKTAVEVMRRANKGAHAADAGDLEGLVLNTERVAKDVLSLR